MIRAVEDNPEDLDIIRSLFREYQDYLQIDLCFQAFDEELAALPGKYAVEKKGALFIAESDQQPIEPIGCVAYYRFDETTCELKRLFVQPQFHGQGIGRALLEQAMQDAVEVGYQTMVLDTLRRLEGAGKLYQRFGFSEIEPYNINPQPDVAYYSKPLVAAD